MHGLGLLKKLKDYFKGWYSMAISTRKRKIIIKMIYNHIVNYDYEEDPQWSRVIELSKDKHLPLCQAIEIAEKEFANK